MEPLCSEVPKPLLPVAGRSLLERMLDGLRAAEVDRVVLVVEHQAHRIEAAVADLPGLDVVCVRQGEPRGTGHAVAVGAGHVSGDALVVVADCLVDPDTLRDLAAAPGFAVAVAEVEDPTRYGVLAVEGGRVTGVEEKPEAARARTVNTGLYRVPRAALDACAGLSPSPRGELEFTDVLRAWAERGEVSAVPARGWHDVGTPWDYLLAHEVVLPAESARHVHEGRFGGGGHVEDGVFVRGRLWVEPGGTVRSGTYIEGDVYVSAGADVGPNAYLRGVVFVGREARVGAATEVKNSILLERARAPHHNYVGDSVLGRDCNLGSGTKLANLRFDKATVRVDWRGRILDTGRRKFGAIVGDRAQTGINASLMPGTILAAGASVAAGSVASGWVD